ncbi:MAG: alkaline shock response membrane anchor protein AmaP [Candidatus Omnitrophica bacterium]|nr:alkaline shock response membrane anchor protein AmaP [Candidatus Omnitrophota bacterium]
MNFFRRLFNLVYALLMILTGAVFILLALDLYTAADLGDMLAVTVYQDITVKTIVGAAGGVFILIGIFAPYRMGKKLKKDRVISFSNPDGEVSVSLSAIEDYIKKIARTIPGIRDLKARVDVTKKGIDVVIAVSLSAGANIPEVTELIQMEVRSRVQSMIGVEEKINVTMHINRIEGSKQPELPSAEPAPELDEEQRHVPFREIE